MGVKRTLTLETQADLLHQWPDTTHTADLMLWVSKPFIEHTLGIRMLSVEERVPVTPIELLMEQPRDSIQHHSKETEEFRLVSPTERTCYKLMNARKSGDLTLLHQRISEPTDCNTG